MKQDKQCILLRSGIELWVSKQDADKLFKACQNLDANKLVTLNGRLFNTADLVGIFNATEMDAMRRRKEGQWFCSHEMWHKRGEECKCALLYGLD